MRNALAMLAFILSGQGILAADTELSEALTACSGTQPSPDVVLDSLRSGGWTEPDAANLETLAQGFQFGSLLYDHIDGSREDAASSQKEFATKSAEIIKNTLEKTIPPFDKMNAHILAAPNGTVAEFNWSEIGGKLYFTCRISPETSTSYDGAAATVEKIFVDPYLERTDTKGTVGSKSVWQDYDNEQLYIYGVNEGVLGPSPVIAVQTLVSSEG